MDVFSDVLHAVNLIGSVYFTTDFSSPWGVRVPAYQRVSRFHLVLRGSCWVGAGGESTWLETGDLVVIPHGQEHTLSDDPTTRCETLDRVVERAGFGGEGPLVIDGGRSDIPCRLLCGHLEFDESIDHPLLRQLPSHIVVADREGSAASEVEDLVRIIAREVRGDRAGASEIVRRLSEVLFIQAVRAWAETDTPDQGFLGALADPHVYRALSAMHADAPRNWTLPELAREAGLSRTGFAERFRQRVGMTAIQYLAFWRMQKARESLDSSDQTVEAVASSVGYDSLPAFSRAFKRWTGLSPGAYRREQASRD